jgi:acyl-CoA synthetase (AMP-forming)/AMP-acid ligase II
MIIIEKSVGFLGADPSHLGLIQLPSLLNQGTLRQEVLFSTKKEADETVYLYYSSGTTGKPKGVEVSLFYPVVFIPLLFYMATKK